MNNAQTLESMLDTIARLPVKDEAAIRAAFEDPKPAEVSIGERGIGLTLGKARAAYVTSTGHITGGLANFGSIAPVTKTFVLGEVAAPVVAEPPPVAHPVDSAAVREVESDLPRVRRRENGKSDLPPVAAA